GRQSTKTLGPTISTFAGSGTGGCGTSGGAVATQTPVCPQGLALGPDGSVYIASANAGTVYRVAPDGSITRVAGPGNGVNCFSVAPPCGDGGPATQAHFSGPWALAVGPDNSLYIGESGRPV